MTRSAFEVADVLRKHLSDMPANGLAAHQWRTLNALALCRSAALGGHIDGCDHCGHLRISYNSCRNRHCPKCQGVEKEAWIVLQEDMLLPVAYFHIVFTLPHQFNALCLMNDKVMYDALFKATWATLQQFAQDPKWLGAKTSATMVLHTWGQNLSVHPHLHCIVPNGGLTKDGKWQFPKRGKENFLFPVVAMTKVFKAQFIKLVRKLHNQGVLTLPDHISNFRRFLSDVYKLDWVIYTKKPFSGAKHVIDYLGRYSHRVAITNSRIIDISNGKVTFEYKDYKSGGVKKSMSIDATEFIRRLSLHILPKSWLPPNY